MLRYRIDVNHWSQAPNLNYARQAHSSCVLKHFLYVFAGFNGVREIDSIEFIDLLVGTAWEYFSIEGLSWRQRASMIAMDSESILIMGGWHDGHPLADAHVVDAKTRTTR